MADVAFAGSKYKVGDRVVYKREGHRPYKPQPGDRGTVISTDGGFDKLTNEPRVVVEFDRVGVWICRLSSFEEVSNVV